MADFRLETERLVLRRFRGDDGRDLHEYLSDPEVVKFEPYEPLSPEVCREEASRRASDPDFYAVERREDGKMIGNLYFAERDFDAWELGYVFGRAGQHRGYATESIRALLRHAFGGTACRRVVAKCDPLNPASWKLLERLGFRRESLERQTHWFKRGSDGSPRWADTCSYALLRDEFPTSPPQS